MKIAVLTSSRADYGIYFPLLKILQNDPFFDLSIIAFGTHLSNTFGFTLHSILNDGFNVTHTVETLPDSDTPQDISRAMGKIMTQFSDIWNDNKFDLLFCLGDRFEMFAACASSIPFNLKLAHIHGGEQTLGAIDESFRHAITHMSTYHFTTTDQYRDRVIQLKLSTKNVFNVGALSIDNLTKMELFSTKEFKEKYGIDIEKPSILITFHPETVSFEKNIFFVNELINALEEIPGYQFIITMPNSDTMGNEIRTRLNTFVNTHIGAFAVESFGTLGYLSCMKYCSFMLGNTSSGFVEAAFFSKYVINLGSRQKGRILTNNINCVPINKNAILQAVAAFENFRLPVSLDIYGNGTAADQIVNIIKKIHDRN